MSRRPLADFTVPSGGEPAATHPRQLGGTPLCAATWTGAELARLVGALARGSSSLRALDDEPLLAAWSDTVESFLSPGSPEREAILPALLATSGLSPNGLAAGLAAVLGGVRHNVAAALLARAHSLPPATRGPALVVLAGNLPALAVQPLLPAMALRRPLLLKSSSEEPIFAPAFLAALRRRLPALGDGFAAVAWAGGDAGLEAPVLEAVERVLAYGDAAAMASLARRAPGKVIDYGPKLSFAVIGADSDLPTAAAGVARDVALFDQRGCLSVQAAFVAGEERARAFASLLADALTAIARELPAGVLPAAALARVQQLRGEAELRGALAGSREPARGTVIVEPAGAELEPSPGLRTVRVYPLASLDELPPRLAGWRGLLQGAALAGEDARWLGPPLAALGVLRMVAPGELQSADGSWCDGGHDPLTALA